MCIFKDVLECSITCELPENYLSEARKEKVIQCGSRRKDSLHKTIGSSSIQYHKNSNINYTSNDHINRYLRWKCAEEPGTSQEKLSRRSLTGIFEFKKPCIMCSEHCNIIKDKKHADRWGKNKRLHCKQQTGEMGIYLLKEHYCR